MRSTMSAMTLGGRFRRYNPSTTSSCSRVSRGSKSVAAREVGFVFPPGRGLYEGEAVRFENGIGSIDAVPIFRLRRL